MNKANRLLVVDDDADMRAFYRDVAEGMHFTVEDSADGAHFLAAQYAFSPTAVIVDLAMPRMDGVEILRNLAARSCKADIILASGRDDSVLAAVRRLGRLLGLRMHATLQKPISVEALENALRARRPVDALPTVEEIRHAIEADEFLLHFQPKVSLESGDLFPIVGCEALVRWKRANGELTPPAMFIATAEQNGLIGPLTELVIQKAISALQYWYSRGAIFPVSVNLSPAQLADLSLPDRLAEKLADAGIPSALLCLEVTEQALLEDPAKAIDVLTRLRLKGLPVSLDDFGAGYSSLAELYRMPLSEIKLDRSLVVDLEHDERARKIVTAFIALSKDLNLTVCAEGVESVATAHLLRDIGCTRAQGFLFGRPLGAAEFTNLVRENHMKGAASR